MPCDNMELNMNNDPNDMFEETVDDVVLNTLIHYCFASQKIVDYDHVITNIVPSQNHHPIKLFKINITRN
jgi:hypothetical protein